MYRRLQKSKGQIREFDFVKQTKIIERDNFIKRLFGAALSSVKLGLQSFNIGSFEFSRAADCF